MNHEPTHLDLFSGIGGFALAAGWAGYRTVGFCEVDPYATRVLAKHWPDVRNYGDIRRADFAGIGRIDLLTGGFPCQPFSCAGKRGGKEDDRHLWPSMLRVIASARPAWVIGENVAGIITMELENCCLDLENAGYEVQPIIIPACAVDAPHRRDRVWIVAHADAAGERRAEREEEIEGDALANANSGDGYGRNCNVQVGRHRGEEKTQTDYQQAGVEWSVEPDVGRVAHGIPNRVDRLKGLGNAIVPQVAYQIIKAIREVDHEKPAHH